MSDGRGTTGTGRGGGDRLLAAVTAVRSAVATATLPLALPGVEAARLTRSRLLDQLDDYVIPRLTSLDAPVLAVVGGSTGSGKSTLVNSVVGQEVSVPGVLRPTTRSPVLVHHPDDATWFTGQRVLPGLARVTGAAGAGSSAASGEGGAGSGSLRLVATAAVPTGLALVDAPDIDSVVASNRDLAVQLLAAADLWVFVTTAARYADAVPWDLLREAGERGTAVAVVLDRVPPEAATDIREHLGEMLREQGLGSAPVFTVVESSLKDGRLPEAEVAPLRTWLGDLAGDAAARADVVRQTLAGAVDSLGRRLDNLAEASRAQAAAVGELSEVARDAYDGAQGQVERGMLDGSLLRGEVLARWQEFVGTGELFRQVESTVSRLRDRVTAFVRGEPPKTENLGDALQSGVESLVLNCAELAASTTARQWRSDAAGRALVTAHPELGRSSPDLGARVERLVRAWQGDILDLVRSEGKDRRTTARVMAYGVNGLGVVLMLVTFASTAGIMGAEVGIAGGTAVVGQKLLEAVFGDQAVRELSRRARELLLERVAGLYDDERDRFDDVVAALEVDPAQVTALSAAARDLEKAR
ncbi:dynamin family protein [Terracoccus luteus]|uniref:Dynamin N-terminal domain-containing protein n=1 Tax=Terracoccus luteus TaxID=53356 RepID=A0A839Q2V0_9MICO|nr:GTPase domain-containing protein [Terracoccus luteus]MBB2986961.1 hypothetical protein [Terracoccus luteus]MCP2172612.1 hypothetical protein [Terracoccus luteus]